MPKQIFDNDEPLLDYDDIDELASMGIGDRGYAEINPPRGSDELFEDQFERRAREIQRTPNNLQPVLVVPQKYGPWSGNNQFGIEQPFEGVANNQQTILKLPEWEFPQVWSVMLASSRTQTVGADYSVIAVVETGVGGITDTFEVDWNTGICFSVVTNALNVVAKFEKTTLLPDDLRLRVMVGKRPLQGSAPTRTITGLSPAGGSVRLSIPKYAASFTVLPGPSPNNDVYNALANYQTTVSPGVGFLSNVGGAQVVSLGSGGRVSLPGQANFLDVVNNTGIDIEFALVFNLGL